MQAVFVWLAFLIVENKKEKCGQHKPTHSRDKEYRTIVRYSLVGIHLISRRFVCKQGSLAQFDRCNLYACMLNDTHTHKLSNFLILSSDFCVAFARYLSKRSRKFSEGEKRNRKQKLSICVNLWSWYFLYIFLYQIYVFEKPICYNSLQKN